MPSDYGKSDYKEIGILSSQLPSYVRHCCRSLYDGTDNEVLNAYRTTAYRVLSEYRDRYEFARRHAETLQIFTPEMTKDLVRRNKKMVQCLATSTHQGLPKRACLHCPRLTDWLELMFLHGTMNEQTGVRNDYRDEKET